MAKIAIHTELTDSHKSAGSTSVVLAQKVVNGPENLLDRKVTLLMPQEDAAALAVRILKELVPMTMLKKHVADLERLAEVSKE